VSIPFDPHGVWSGWEEREALFHVKGRSNVKTIETSSGGAGQYGESLFRRREAERAGGRVPSLTVIRGDGRAGLGSKADGKADEIAGEDGLDHDAAKAR
jgi:hypothetical protein